MADNKVKLQATPLFVKNRDAKTRVVVNEGGSRSSKTYSILEVFIADALESNEPKEFDIVRETFPALRSTAMKDFFDIIQNAGIYDESCYNKTTHTYVLNGCNFNFYSVDEPQKIRGRKRHKVLMNEANEMSLETFRQLEMRTEEQLFLDYNPSEEESWIYDHVLSRPDCTFIHSTYKDNPFLAHAIIDTIENYKTDDAEYWKIYGMGLRGKRQGLIFTNWDVVDSVPSGMDDVLYGVDFGFNDPKVLTRLTRKGNDIWIEELLYRSEMMREDFIKEMKKLIPKEHWSQEIIADNEPETIEAIYRAGFNIHPADKESDSVLAGIEEVKSYALHITAGSVNVLKDFRNYKWKMDKNGHALDKPVHSFSHACDSVRYPVHTHWGKSYKHITNQDMRGIQIEVLRSSRITAGYV